MFAINQSTPPFLWISHLTLYRECFKWIIVIFKTKNWEKVAGYLYRNKISPEMRIVAKITSQLNFCVIDGSLFNFQNLTAHNDSVFSFKRSSTIFLYSFTNLICIYKISVILNKIIKKNNLKYYSRLSKIGDLRILFG